MGTELQFPQRSEEWYEARRGKITGSKFGLLMPSSKQKMTDWNKTQLDYLYTVACEILTGNEEENYVNSAMQWGIDKEAEAIEAYKLETFNNVRECGFFEYSDFIGSSPDGIINKDEAVLEIKCPSSKQHLKYLINPEELLEQYYWQVYGEMLCTGIYKSVICSYDPRFPDGKQLVIVEHEAVASDMDRLNERLNLAIEKVKEFIK